MAIPAFRKESSFTYREYVGWEGEERFELFDGIPVSMTPAPGREHQDLTGTVYAELRSKIKSVGSPCRALIAPFDVVLPRPGESEDDAKTVVQPDVIVVCDEKKLTARNCLGAPYVVVEVLSPSTARRDQREKYNLYEAAGVREYWIVDPVGAYLIRHVLSEEGRFRREGVYVRGDELPLDFLLDTKLSMDLIFEEEETLEETPDTETK